ncbi:unnamed protein product [Rhizopus stolonifer]
MEAIDEFANENIVRSIVFSAVDKMATRQYQELLPISSQPLQQRAKFLGTEDWYRWQKDRSCDVLEDMVSYRDNLADELYQKPVYYKRLDADTLHALVEFAEKDQCHYVVILLLGEGSSEISDIKYHNVKEIAEEEWLDIFTNWSRSLEEAERIYLTKVTRPKKVFSNQNSKIKETTADDYWGEWSSDEEEEEEEIGSSREEPDEDEYYSKWSKEATITQQEIEEEYDQSYNPLFTVPSVPNLMDTHTAALSELTQMLKTSLPSLPDEKLPGAYPESGNRTPAAQTKYYQEAGRQLFMKSLRALIGAAKLLGYEGKDILDMVDEIVNKE